MVGYHLVLNLRVEDLVTDLQKVFDLLLLHPILIIILV